MKIPSIGHLYNGLIAVIKRFPVEFVLALIATFCWCYYINISDYYTYKYYYKDLKELLIKGVLVCNLCLALTLSIDLFAEKQHFNLTKKWIFRLISIGICTTLFFILNPSEHLADVYRIALLAFSFHLFVAFSPFIGKENINGFWQFNKVLFLRFLVSALYSAVLYGGLAVALLAIDGLFNVEIRWKVYLSVFAIITAGFNTIFFLAGIPSEFESLNEDTSYPKGLKIFTQFVLIPLMTIYLVILLLYEAKIIVAWELPKGLVSSLIIGYSIFGILSLLLIYPIKGTEGNNWIKLFSRFFYVMLIPLVVLLLLAVWKRVGPYGITESRYILVVLALWLAGITTYFLLSKKQNIKLIPISLAIVALLSVYGPQSASAIAKYSQLARLKRIIKSDEKKNKEEKPSIIRYLVNVHGLTSLQGLTSTDLSNVEYQINQKKQSDYARAEEKLDTAFAILKIKDLDTKYSNEQYSFVNQNNDFLTVRGFDYVLEISPYETEMVRTIEGKEIKIEKSSGENILISIGDSSKMEIYSTKMFAQAIADMERQKLKPTVNDHEFNYPLDKMTVTKIINQYQYTFIATKMSGNKNTNVNWLNINGYLLIKKL